MRLPPQILPILMAAAAMSGLRGADPYLQERRRMVQEQIGARGISNPEVLRAMRETPRHLFVPPALAPMAYGDRPLPIGYGATISQPYVVAWMTALLDAGKKDRVLEIGTGSGYQAAILAQRASHVYTIEIVPELAQSARETLRELGYPNVSVRQGDGYKGWPEEAPFDRIIVTAAPPSIPKVLTDQLANGGRMIVPVGSTPDQELTVIEKRSDGTLRRRTVGGVTFVPMRPGRD